MANVLDLRRRIRSVKNTRQITKAMKMVSAAKLRRAQERAISARPYAKMITSVLESLTRRIDIFDPETGNLRHPLFASRPEKRVLLIVISGDKGFAGAFNANILKTAYQFIAGNPDKEIDAAYIVYNEFKSVIQQRLVVEKLLPLLKIGIPQITGAVEPTEEERERAAEAALSAGISLEPADTAEADEEAKKFGTSQVDYIYEEPAEDLFNGLLPQYVSSTLYHAMTESVAAEHAARMTAMDSATNNASDMIDALTLNMNRVRQAAITKEI